MVAFKKAFEMFQNVVLLMRFPFENHQMKEGWKWPQGLTGVFRDSGVPFPGLD